MARRKIFIVALSVLVFVVLTVYSARGWIRGAVMPAYVSRFYSNSLRVSFLEDFSLPNQWLSKHSLGFNSYIESGKPVCSEHPYYVDIGWTTNCNISQDSSEVRPDDAYRQKWKLESDTFEEQLLTNGWTKQWNQSQPINEILDYHENGSGIGVNYEKTHGSIYCSLSLIFIPDEWLPSSTSTSNNGSLKSGMNCTRKIEFFGGVWFQ